MSVVSSVGFVPIWEGGCMATSKQIGVIGNGNVGGALGRGLQRAGHGVKSVGKDPAGVRDIVRSVEVVILAVPFAAVDDVLKEAAAALAGKVVVDVTNALGPGMQWAIGFTTSGAEELQKKAAGARVVKGFNTVFAQYMETGRLGNQQLTAFIAGDDAAAKETALGLARDIGFDAVDAGPLKNARLLEALGFLNIELGYARGMGREIGFKLLH
jgi:8-hydroxy-5-deazaflavin:NADPH oxidoreductase